MTKINTAGAVEKATQATKVRRGRTELAKTAYEVAWTQSKTTVQKKSLLVTTVSEQ